LSGQTYDISILLINNMLHILQHLLNMIGIHDSRDTRTDRKHADLARVGAVEHHICTAVSLALILSMRIMIVGISQIEPNVVA
jgi:hypothetical protein